MNASDFKHVSYNWDDAKAPSDPVELLVYRSNCLGADQRVTNTGGGNTSNKIIETDPLTGEQTEVLWVKGSGGDLRTSKRGNFSSLYLDKLESLKSKFGNADPKSEEEDAMVGMYPHCTFNLNPRPSSIDTPLHAYIPHKYVDHMHPNAAIAIAACKDQEKLNKEIWGDQMAYVDWQRPGFDLGLQMEKIAKENPNAIGILMGQHGLINWSDESDKACYELTLSLIEKAAAFIEKHDKGDKTFGGEKYKSLDDAKRNETLHEILPWLRGQVSQQNRFIGTVEYRDSVLRFVNSNDAKRLAEIGTSCPDHFLRTKIKPLYVDWDPTSGTDKLRELLTSGLEQYRKDYADYYESCKRPDSPAMRDPNPTVILIPGVGMVAWGKNKSESRVTAEFYCCAVEVMRGAEAVSEYQGLPRQEAFDIEYWSLEEAKLQRMPAEQELARQVCVVIGGGSGIGKETCHRLVKEGAEIVAVDLNEQAAKGTAEEIEAKVGKGIGVAGTGISGCGDAIGLSADITDADSCRVMLEHVLLAYGGVDQVLVTAGYFATPDNNGVNTPDQWDRSFKINVTGLFNAADTAHKILKAQGLGGGIVLTTSVNAVVAKKGSFPYDTSKAAANHLVRELAVAYAPDVRVNGVAPATVVAGSSMFPKDRVMASLSKYDIKFDENADEDTLRNQLADFYAKRTLTHKPIRPIDQAEAIFLLASDRLSRTTGQIITVDGGLQDAFLR